MSFYLDNAATTAVLPQARQAALAAMEDFGNPGSLHALGRRARAVLDQSREQLAEALGCAPGRLTFTSGGSESVNTALFGAARKNRRLGNHILSTKIEHDATLNALKALEAQGFCPELAAPRRDGQVAAEDLIAALRPDTILVSLMAVCNETGAVLPIREVARAMKRVCPRALLHVDGVQGFCKIPLPMEAIDLLSLSAHKIGGMKGCGALYIREGVKIAPLIYGGNQENGLRSGTEAMPQIAAFGAAAQARRQSFEKDAAYMAGLRDRLISGAGELGWQVNTPPGGAPHIVNLSPGKGRSEVYIRALSDKGVYVSGGSACARGKKSHVLAAMELPAKAIDSALRVSFCPETPAEAVDVFLRETKAVMEQLF